ncbi:hypothetical protein AAHT98_27300 (plasmid) [Klebsiella pneumoniae]|jgi:hypothetical protein|uniref:hypothetical protein n=1 Tax=Escherichia coli TaxID=562 RepID=UPI00284FB3CB|nr:hypothetical protein [Salmonella enterica subsp. enterica serovar Typhimurium]EDT6027344.1 hypothetical protein [Salmonella enterica subsp. enterica]ELC0810693.1 hypothetical protein [Klebsiella pneumoniae]HAX9594467.1 hypothetical protein [Escherichia coli]ECN7865096.1 hypothetical protein [Salmonella enterica subsp. enterica serovar Typhimurium]
MDRIIKYKGFIQFVIFAIFLYGVYWIAIKPPYTAQKSYADLVEENTNDPSAPPIISSTMRDPSWSIRYWLDVDKKSSDCVMADEIMDKGGNVKILRKRGAVIKEYYLADYISSCKNRINRSLEMVDKRAKKWCDFKNTDHRLQELCTEWTNNKDIYLATIHKIDDPTLYRYDNYPNK